MTALFIFTALSIAIGAGGVASLFLGRQWWTVGALLVGVAGLMPLLSESVGIDLMPVAAVCSMLGSVLSAVGGIRSAKRSRQS